jgi:hypothetical protein
MPLVGGVAARRRAVPVGAPGDCLSGCRQSSRRATSRGRVDSRAWRRSPGLAPLLDGSFIAQDEPVRDPVPQVHQIERSGLGGAGAPVRFIRSHQWLPEPRTAVLRVVPRRAGAHSSRRPARPRSSAGCARPDEACGAGDCSGAAAMPQGGHPVRSHQTSSKRAIATTYRTLASRRCRSRPAVHVRVAGAENKKSACG